MSLQTIHIDFSGQMKSIQGDVRMQGLGNAFKKGAIACGILWLLAIGSSVIPFIAWTAPFIFLGVGPIVGLIIFFMDRHEVRRVETQAVCPQCNTAFEITEINFKPPFYGSCPECRTSYRVDL